MVSQFQVAIMPPGSSRPDPRLAAGNPVDPAGSADRRAAPRHGGFSGGSSWRRRPGLALPPWGVSGLASRPPPVADPPRSTVRRWRRTPRLSRARPFDRRPYSPAGGSARSDEWKPTPA